LEENLFADTGDTYKILVGTPEGRPLEKHRHRWDIK
jgi:hypothetical protein